MEKVNSGAQYDIYLECCEMTGIINRPTLKVTENNKLSPFAIGFTRGKETVVVPKYLFESGSPVELKATIIHELCHIKNRDSWVNLVRFICFCLFHVHPVRIIADFQINRFQEICRDMDVIRYLKIQPKDYAKILFDGYSNAEMQREAPIVYSNFLNTNKNFIKRITFLHDKIHSSNSRIGKWSSSLAIILFSLLLFNPSFSAVQTLQQTIDLSEAERYPELPIPINILETLTTSSSPIIKVIGEEVWIAEPTRGLFVIRLNSDNELVQIRAFPIQITGSSRITDFDVESDTVVLSIGDDNRFETTEHTQIHILTQTETDFIRTSVIEEFNAASVQIVDGNLWAGGVLDFTGAPTGVLAVFKIENVIAPEFLNEVFFEQIPKQIVHSQTDPQKVFVLYGNQLEVFENDELLNSYQLISLESDGHSITLNGENEVLISAIQSTDAGGNTNPRMVPVVHKLRLLSNSMYSISHKVDFMHDEYPTNFGITSINPYQYGIFLSFNQSGFTFIDEEMGNHRVQLWSDKPVTHSFILNEYLFVVTTNAMYQFIANDVVQPKTLVSNWQDHQL